MAFGRLEVYFPDGAFKTFLLSESNISVGRSTGNMIALDVDGISRYHLTLSHKDGETRITDLDSANGTFIDSERLTPQQPRTLFGGEEIQFGELRLVYHAFDETPTRPVIVPEDTTRRIEIPEGTFALEVTPPDQAVSPGAHISAQVTVTNKGDETKRYTVEVSGLPLEWVRIDRRELEIAPDKAGDIVLNFKPRRRSESAPGHYTVTVIVRVKDKPADELRAHFTLQVLPFGGFGMALEQRNLKAGDNFRLHVHNQGSDNLPLHIKTREVDEGVQVAIAQPRFTLAPGQRSLIQGKIEPQKARIFGSPRRYAVDLNVRSEDAAGFITAQRLYMVEKPPLPSWAVYVIGGIGLALAALVLLALVLVLRPAPAAPQFAFFRADSANIQQGQPINVSWNASNADEIDLLINGVLVRDNLPSEQNSAQIESGGYTGEVVIQAIASNGTQTAESFTSVMITPSLRVASFTINPPVLVRHVAQTLTLNWRVSGAVSTRINGVEAFSSAPIQTDYGAEGTLSVAGIPNSPFAFTITLTALSETGEATQQSITVDLVDPQCTASTGSVALYGSPDGRGQIVATAPQHTTVVVDGQDSSGQWLRVRLSGGAYGWGRTDALTCASNFNVSDLLRILEVPTAMPDPITPSPSVSPSTLTPLPTATLNAPQGQQAPLPTTMLMPPTSTMITPAPSG